MKLNKKNCQILDSSPNLYDNAPVVAIFTFNKTLVKYINSIKQNTIVLSQENQVLSENIRKFAERIVVINFHKWAYNFLESNGYKMKNRIVSGKQIMDAIDKIKTRYNFSKLSSKCTEFFVEEIAWLKGKNIRTYDEYLDIKRINRGSSDRVTKADREIIWSIFMDYQTWLTNNKKIDFDDMALINNLKNKKYDIGEYLFITQNNYTQLNLQNY